MNIGGWVGLKGQIAFVSFVAWPSGSSQGRGRGIFSDLTEKNKGIIPDRATGISTVSYGQ
ncbi:hypothetical protein H8B13_03475 [Hymenobacter sp. BT188]|uniref:hypothetical protein n=1 Tax=Hymenobacter sp. BT188 TaxID=2763504 RepID=UPI001650FFD9|nr:hypothetical protein [Hymenobacter sp. BT188]MBC6605870.1 hypothetical protein [Hymenobacter sp. BT188]